MTNTEAIEHIKEVKVLDIEFPNDLQIAALDMAINALSAIEDIRAELLKDYVDDNPQNFTVAIVNLKDVIEIIDKHRGKEQE